MSQPIVAICTDHAADAKTLLEQTLEKAAFWKGIEQVRKKKKLAASDFRIVIKPDMGIYEGNGTTGTDPALVEHLMGLLAGRGYTNMAIADADEEASLWLDNREVYSLADLIGYRYVTANGTAYEVVSLSEDLKDAAFEPSSVLYGATLSAHWQEAHFRILFSKNKTDEEFYYALCLKTLMDILPLKAKGYHYYHGHKPEEVALELLKRGHVHFCLIDAYISNHGMQGLRHSHPLETHTFIASNHLLLADWAGALKMGLDPYVSSINGHALQQAGLPAKYKIEGDFCPYAGWKNVPLLLATSVKARNANPLMRQLANAWLQTVDTDLFPFKNVTDAQANQFLAPLVKDVDQHPLAYSALIALNYFLAGFNKSIHAYRTLYNKEKIVRQQVALGFEVDEFTLQDFEAIENYIVPLSHITAHTPPDANRLKWRYINDSVLFEFSRTLPYDYTAFISKVDISQSVQYMYDNIGGVVVVVKKNSKGQTVYQAERDIYLPQPNWMVLFGSDPIDVCKIEVIRYGKNYQTIYWRTVKSLNHSAVYDDGLVTFSAYKKGITEIKIVARQRFALPLFWQVFNIDYLPQVKDALVSDSYIRFFSRTIANFEAAYEGRHPQIGRTISATEQEAEKLLPTLQIDQLKEVLGLFSGMVTQWTGKEKAGPMAVDDDGYQHFRKANGDTKGGSALLQSFVADLTKAVQKDIRYISHLK